ncbi:GFO_IDH_MocA domain-containing protein [Tenacibaculum sp. 190524A02b]|uniref:GFO_IDH_MocA domain-containing protein n=1 Tax=Tenacibaculum vairaonense TaxID=3137860 RepID=A0ABM9PJP9_9FLAO
MLRIGVLGLSEGNGHPYSWSAIFNGYDKEKKCPFDVIPEYLNKQTFPDDFLSGIGKVTHIWTQDKGISKSVAEFSHIDNIVEEPEEMIGQVDVVLLARDDAENHYEMAKVFIENNIPIFIDKPLAFNLEEARRIFEINEKSLVYSCSSIRFAKEFSEKIFNGVYYVNAMVMKSWKTYGIHVIEPVVSMFPNRGKLLSVQKAYSSLNVKIRVVEWENLTATFTTSGKMKSSIRIDIMNSEFSKELLFKDTFYAFRESLRNFIEVVKKNEINISKDETLEIIEIIEKGI